MYQDWIKEYEKITKKKCICEKEDKQRNYYKYKYCLMCGRKLTK